VGNAVAPATTAAPSAVAMPMRDVVASSRASRIIGANVHNDRGESIGAVEDLVLRRDDAGPMAVISVGGFLGIGGRLVGVPLSELRYVEADQRWMLTGATKESLQNRPEVTYAARG
jgi:sporulation protein YlmC with PRC-barrel domain